MAYRVETPFITTHKLRARKGTDSRRATSSRQNTSAEMPHRAAAMATPLAVEAPPRQTTRKHTRVKTAIRPVSFRSQPGCTGAGMDLGFLRVDITFLPTAHL